MADRHAPLPARSYEVWAWSTEGERCWVWVATYQSEAEAVHRVRAIEKAGRTAAMETKDR